MIATTEIVAPAAPVELVDATLQRAIRQYEGGKDINEIAKTLGHRSVVLQKKMRLLLGVDEWRDATTANIDSCMALVASNKAVGLAFPTSSLAAITRRRAIKTGSSPPSIIRAR